MSKNKFAFLLSCAVAIPLCVSLPAQIPQEPRDGNAESVTKPSEVRLGPGSGAPGEDVTLPLHWTPAPGVQIGSLTLEISFAGKVLAFYRSFPAPAPKVAGVEFRPEVKKSSVTSSKSILRLQISTTRQQALPQGLLGYVTFGIDKHAGRETLRLDIESLEAKGLDPSAESAKPVRGVGAKVTLMDPGQEPIFGCFFYMH